MHIKTNIFTLSLTAILLVIGCTCAAQQSASAAKSVLDQVSGKYDSYRTIMADFAFKATSNDGDSYADSGKLKMDKASNKYYINFQGQQIISDGKSVWSVLTEEKEVQVSDVDQTAGTLGPQNLFTFYRKGYRYTLKPDERVKGESMKVVELEPQQENSNYTRIRLRINRNSHIHDITIADKGGAQYVYTINALYVNQKIPQETFTFRKSSYPGFDMVDLR